MSFKEYLEKYNITSLQSKELYIGERDLTDLEGIQMFTKLKLLSCPSNRIKDLSPISCLTSLTNLNIACNYVTSLTPLYPLINLSFLYVQNNPLKNYEGIENIKKLYSLMSTDYTRYMGESIQTLQTQIKTIVRKRKINTLLNNN